jgi:isopentenyl diphosphate isomerase/L-lactate dehydrogenase-like FMN-dependent dehydrogenase
VKSTRRAFLRFLAGSPLLLSELTRGQSAPEVPVERIEAAAQAVDVFDLRTVAEHKLSPAHYTFLAMGVDDEFTLRANREAFAKWQLRPRRLVDTRSIDTACELLGTRLSCPIVLAPCGSQKTFHPEGELAVARAARRKDHLQILSTSSSSSLEDVVDARGAPIWFQLYAPRLWPATRWLLREAEREGCPALVLTVDMVMPGENRLRIRRFRRDENAECQPCHGSALDPILRSAASVARAAGIEPREWLADSMTLDWGFFDRLRDATALKLLIKGILTPEDARLAVEHGADGIIVSNHGGRAEDVGVATIDVLPGIADAVAGHIPVLVDSGFRRGSDVVKALALGARAVCVGRPYLWGLAAFGQEGVEAVLALLRRELELSMKALGTPTLAAITRAHVQRAEG